MRLPFAIPPSARSLLRAIPAPRGSSLFCFGEAALRVRALNYVFSKDRDFQEYLKTARSSNIVPTLRVRRAGNGDAAEAHANGKGLVAGVEVRNNARR